MAYADGADTLTVLAVRFVVACTCLLALMHARGHTFPRGRTLLALMGLGGIGYVTQSLTYFYALTMASAGLAALLLYLYPAIVAVLAAVVLGQRLTPVKIGAVAVALAGTVLTIGQIGGGRPLGVVLGVASALAYAVYILLGSQVSPRVGPIPSTTVILLTAGAVLLVVTAIRGPQFPDSATGWLSIVALGIVSTVVAVVTFFAGVERIGPSEASTVSTVEPVVTVALAAVVLGETVSPGQMLGGMLVLGAVITLAWAGRPVPVPETTPPA